MISKQSVRSLMLVAAMSVMSVAFGKVVVIEKRVWDGKTMAQQKEIIASILQACDSFVGMVGNNVNSLDSLNFTNQLKAFAFPCQFPQVTQDFIYTWTALQGTEDRLCTKIINLDNHVTSEFQQTWTFLDAIQIYLASKIDEVDVQVNIILDDEFQQTWTAIREATDILCTKIMAMDANVTSEFQQTWTMLQANINKVCDIQASLNDFVDLGIDAGLVANNALIQVDINAARDNINAKTLAEFQQTWTAIASICPCVDAARDNINATTLLEFQQTWTQIGSPADLTSNSFSTNDKNTIHAKLNDIYKVVYLIAQNTPGITTVPDLTGYVANP